MFAQHGKTGDDDGKKKTINQTPPKSIDHITCNDCGVKGHYAGNSELSTQTKLKEDAESIIKKSK